MITSPTARIPYTVTTSPQTFAVPFYFLAAADLAVVATSAAGVDTPLTLNSDYTVSGAGTNPSTATVILSASIVGATLTIYRNAQITQPAAFIPNDRFPAATQETAFDRMTMQVQQLALQNSRAVRFPVSNAAAGEMTVAQRKNKRLGFDGVGAIQFEEPVAVTLATGSVMEVSSYSAARALSSSGLTTGRQVTVSGYSSSNDGAYGLFTFTSVNPGTDNNGTILALGDGLGWLLRNYTGAVNAKWFAAKGNGSTDDTTAIQAAITFASLAGKSVYLPAGIYMISAPLVFPTGITAWGVELVGHKPEGKYEYLPGTASTIIRAVAASAPAAMVQAAGSYYSTLRNLVIDGNNTAVIGFSNGYQDNVIDCTVLQCTTAGIDLNALTNNTKLIRTSSVLNAIGLRSIGANTTDFYVEKCQLRLNTGDGAYISNGFSARFTETIIEENGGKGVNIKAESNAASRVWNLSFESCWFEGNSGYCVDVGSLGAGPARYTTFLRCFFNANTKCANIGNAQGVKFDGCHFLDSTTTAGYFVVDAAALYVEILGSPDVLGDAAINITGTGAANVIKFAPHPDGYYKMIQPLLAKGLPTAVTLPAGYVGEVISAEVLVGAAVNLTTATIANVTSVVLTPGRWRITGTLSFKQNAATTYIALVGYISTLVTGGGSNKETVQTALACSANGDGSLSFTPLYIDVPAGGNVTRYLNALAYFAVNSMKAYGHITAERYA